MDSPAVGDPQGANPLRASVALPLDPMWQKLLVPHDFSACAGAALGLAAKLARVHRASLVLLHVSPVPTNVPRDALITPPSGGAPMTVAEYATHGAEASLQKLARPLRDGGLAVEVVARASESADISAEILTAAAELGVDALVVGTHGRTGLSHLLLGSVAERVLRRATVPVVTVRAPAPESGPTLEERDLEDETAG
jgi:nucleotide-binding universal stress UspA family protein